MRGVWTIVAMFALGGLVLLGLFLAPRPHSPPAPPGVPFGVPPTPLRVVVYDAAAGGRPLDADSIAADLRKRLPGAGDADYVLLLGVEADQVPALASVLGMQESFEPRLCQRVRRAGGPEPVGACVLSRHPLYEASPLRTSPRETYGVSAVSVVGGRKFLVACVSLSDGAGGAEPATLIDSWRRAGAPPMLVGGGVGTQAARMLTSAGFGGIGPAGEPRDAVTATAVPGPLRLFSTAQWTAGDASPVGSEAGNAAAGVGLIAVVRGASPPAAPTLPSTHPAPADRPQDVSRRE